MNEKIDNKILGLLLLPIYTFIAFFGFFIIGLNKVEAESNIQIKGVNHSFTGSVWNGSQIVKTYDSNLNNPYLGYTSIGNNVMYKLYFHSGVTLNFQTYPMENLTQTRWLYTMDVCTDIPTPLTYKTVTSGNGAIITAYNAMKKGSCSQLGNETNGVLYTYPFVIQYNNVNMGTIYIDGEMVIDVDNGYTQSYGKLAVVNWNVTEFTEEIENQYEQINQNNQVINQNNTIINQNNQTNQNLNNIDNSINETKDYLEDDTPPESDISSLGNVDGLLPAGPLDSLLNIPAKFLSVIVSSFGSQCRPLSGDFIFGSTLTIPCFGESFYNNVPPGLMIFINLIPGVFILIVYFKYLYKKVERATSMDTSTDDMWGAI